MSKKRVFVSFDFDNDKILKEFLVNQAKHPDAPFDLIDGSLKEAAPEADWERKAALRISNCDIVIVMVGAHTHRAPGVIKEVELARRMRKPMFQIIGYRDSNPTPVTNAGHLYAWNWENLKRLLQ